MIRVNKIEKILLEHFTNFKGTDTKARKIPMMFRRIQITKDDIIEAINSYGIAISTNDEVEILNHDTSEYQSIDKFVKYVNLSGLNNLYQGGHNAKN